MSTEQITGPELRERVRTEGTVTFERGRKRIEFTAHKDAGKVCWRAYKLVHGGTQPGTNLSWGAWDTVDFGVTGSDPDRLLSWLEES